MNWTRRKMLAATVFGLTSLGRVLGEERRQHLGVVQYSYALRLAADRAAGKTGYSDPLLFLDHCHELGAGGIQTGIGSVDKASLTRLRNKAEEYGMYLEGTVRLPKDEADGDRFTAEVQAAREAGAKVLRTVLLGGRRYEQFASAEAFRQAAEQARRALERAEPIVRRHDMRLAVENHKDFRAGELAALLERLGSRHVGACVDTGNSIALLEDPLAVVETLAPWVFSVHLKDMAVQEYEEGLLLAEVPLGTGFLDLAKMIAVLRRARPEIHFNLEMITRDPLRVPCLTEKYWATSADVSGQTLAHTLTLVRKHRPAQPLPRISGLDSKQQLAVEEENNRRCLEFARQKLGL
jgi:sugar phosphate isomerase/epimerase